MDRSTAIAIVAQGVLALYIHEGVELEWMNFPDIAENDWHRVVETLEAQCAPHEDFGKAYQYLADQAIQNDLDLIAAHPDRIVATRREPKQWPNPVPSDHG